jgi:hypothetical protein
MKPLLSPLVALVCAVLAFAGCATHINSSLATNPPPAEAFSGFTKIQLGSVRFDRKCERTSDGERALAKIQENLSARMAASLARWNAAGKGHTPVRTLLVDPVVAEMKFVDGNSRFWVGPLAGSSAIILRVRITEYETGKVVATPEFYARASAMGGSFSIGATDNVMLTRIAGRLADYLEGNYDKAVGGTTGVD